MSKVYCMACKYLEPSYSLGVKEVPEKFWDGSWFCRSPKNVTLVDTPTCQQKQSVSPMYKNHDNDCDWFEPNSQPPPTKKPSWRSKLWR